MKKTLAERLKAIGLDRSWLEQECRSADAASAALRDERLPAAVERKLYEFESWSRGMVDTMVAEATRVGRSRRQATAVALLTYASSTDLWDAQPTLRAMALPAPVHSAAVHAARAALLALGIGRADLVRFDPPAYAAWLGNRPANAATRSEWAARQTAKEGVRQQK